MTARLSSMLGAGITLLALAMQAALAPASAQTSGVADPVQQRDPAAIELQAGSKHACIAAGIKGYSKLQGKAHRDGGAHFLSRTR